MSDRSELELKVVYTALFRAKDQWFNLGLQLDINPHDLRGIEANYTNDTEKLREMINLRLNQGSRLTWENIATALENPTIGQRPLAQEIRTIYILNTSTIIGNPAATVTTTSAAGLNRPLVYHSIAGPTTTTTTTTTGNAPSTAILVTNTAQPNSSGSTTKIVQSRCLLQKNATNTNGASGANGKGKSMSVNSRKRPAPTNTTKIAPPRKISRTDSEISRTDSEISRTDSETEYYDEDIFVSKNNTNKYKCIHCKKVPKKVYRCKCTSQVPREDIGKGKPRYGDNTGLSCSNCTSRLCTSCGKSEYELDKHTKDNIRKLKVFCEKKCGETISLAERENDFHVKNKCSKRKRNCMYRWAGCMEEGGGEEIVLHEREPQAGHVKSAIEQLHREIERLRNENFEIQTRLDKIEDKKK